LPSTTYPQDPRECEGFAIDATSCRTSRSELGPLLDSFYLPTGQHSQGNAQNFQAIYVNRISDKTTAGYSVNGNPSWPSIVETDSQIPVPSNYVVNTTAHEMGHLLGEGGLLLANGNLVHSMSHNKGLDYLMSDSGNTAPCRISRDDWNLMNFTQGTRILGADGKAH
jgi:hypothetical protein